MKLMAFLFTVLLMAGVLLPGCSREQMLEGYDTVIQAAGTLGLTASRSLEGERAFGADKYTGTYEAVYEDFTGEEYVFGGTAITRREGETLRVRCVIRAESGSMKLDRNYGSDDPVTLLEGEGTYEDVIYLTPGSNYFALVGGGFTGSVELTME